VLSNLAFEAMMLGRDDDAERAAVRATRIIETKLGPTNRKLAPSLDNLGAVKLARHDDVGALAVFDRARAIVESTRNEADPMLGTLANDRALALMHLGRLDEALTAAREGAARRTRVLGASHLDAGLAVATVAEVLLARGEAAAALAEAARALAIVERAGALESIAYAEVLTTLGAAELRVGDRSAAAKHLGAALRLREAHVWDPKALERTRRLLGKLDP
jgi:tetratricopeptide (TPR) repeat protein